MIKTIIIDDERLARKELRSALAAFKEIDIIEECDNANSALDMIDEKRPDLIFLDIQMPGKTGFDMLEELDIVPYVIFTTAYDEYALKAFEVNALDYLLKPIDEGRLTEAIGKVQTLIEQEANLDSKDLLGSKDQVFVKDGDKCWFVQLSEVRYFESEGNYVRVHFGTNKPMILKSLNNLDRKLDDKVFFRANRKHIINLRWVENIENWFNGGLQVTIKGGEKLEISRRQASKLKEKMSL